MDRSMAARVQRAPRNLKRISRGFTTPTTEDSMATKKKDLPPSKDVKGGLKRR
jgi:hypothetical protein